VDLKLEGKRLLKEFERQFGRGGRPRVALAPGRSNLIGEHTDYNAGLVLPIAVNRHTAVLFRPQTTSGAPRVRVYSDTIQASDEFSLKNVTKLKDHDDHWANYVRGTAWALAKRGVKLKGGDLYIASDLPRGAGLSSSASLEVSSGLAFLALAGKTMARQALAFACQEAEHVFAGVRCGIMDQTVVARARAGHALMLDCESITVRHVPIAIKNYSFAIFDTGVRHKLASSEYNKRRTECEHAARLLRKPSLRAVTLDVLLKGAEKLTANEHKRLRHVTTENQRVVQFAAALTRGDLAEMGRLLHLSHMSLSQDYEVSCRELDMVVTELALRNERDGNCPGARMTGGGFGGAVVSLLKTSAFPGYAKALRPFAKGGSLLLAPAGGACVVNLGG
jgi:galactokinase